MKRLLEAVPETHTEVWWHKDHSTGVVTIEEVQNVEPYLKQAKALRERDTKAPVRAGAPHLTPGDREGIDKEWLHVARLTNTDIVKLKKLGLDVFKWSKCEWTQRKIKQLANSSEWSHLRTGNARL